MAKLNMYSELFEAKENYYLANRDGSFPAVAGTKLSNGLFAHKKDTSFMLWCISDIDSGLLLKGKFKSLKDCKDYVANMSEEEKQKLADIRQTQEYLGLCDRLKEVTSKANESLSFEEAYEELSKEQDQAKLF